MRTPCPFLGVFALALIVPLLLLACGSDEPTDGPSSGQTAAEPTTEGAELPPTPQLNLVGNQLSGEIPPELGNLANPRVLFLEGNGLSGEIPPELGNLANLRHLSLEGNELSGEIPPELGNLASLEGLSLRWNELSGCVPGSLSGRLDMRASYLGDLRFCS